MSRSAETTPTQRLMACTAQIARHYGLSQAGQIQILTQEPDAYTMGHLSLTLLSHARQELIRSPQARREGSRFDLAFHLALHCGWGTTLACTLRTAASAGSSGAIADEAWELLMMVTTLVYVRAKKDNALYPLVTYYNDLAIALNDVEPEL